MILKVIFIFMFTFEGFADMYVCIPLACLVPAGDRRGCWIPWNMSSR